MFEIILSNMDIVVFQPASTSFFDSGFASESSESFKLSQGLVESIGEVGWSQHDYLNV